VGACVYVYGARAWGGAAMACHGIGRMANQRSKRDAPVSGSSLYDFRLRASSARREPPDSSCNTQYVHAYPALPYPLVRCAHRRRI